MDSAATQGIPTEIIPLPAPHIDYSNMRSDFKDLLIEDIKQSQSVPGEYGNSACKYIEKIIEQKGRGIEQYSSKFLGGMIDAIIEKHLEKGDDLYFVLGEFGHATYYDRNISDARVKEYHKLKVDSVKLLGDVFKGPKYKSEIIENFTEAMLKKFFSDYSAVDIKGESPKPADNPIEEKYRSAFAEIDGIYENIVGESLGVQMKRHRDDAIKVIERYALNHHQLKPGSGAAGDIRKLAYFYKYAVYDQLNPKPIGSEMLTNLFLPFGRELRILIKTRETAKNER